MLLLILNNSMINKIKEYINNLTMAWCLQAKLGFSGRKLLTKVLSLDSSSDATASASATVDFEVVNAPTASVPAPSPAGCIAPYPIAVEDFKLCNCKCPLAPSPGTPTL